MSKNKEKYVITYEPWDEQTELQEDDYLAKKNIKDKSNNKIMIIPLSQISAEKLFTEFLRDFMGLNEQAIEEVVDEMIENDEISSNELGFWLGYEYYSQESKDEDEIYDEIT